MWLTGKAEALLCYCLVNTPLEIVEDEIRREHWKQFKIDEDAEIREYVEKKHNFDHLPEKTKVTCDRNSCKNSSNVLNGLGQGRKYDSGDSNTQCGADWQFPKNIPSSNCAQDADVFDYYNGRQVREATNAKQMRYSMPSPNCRRFHNLFAEFFIRYLQFEEGRRRALGAENQVRQNESGAVNDSKVFSRS